MISKCSGNTNNRNLIICNLQATDTFHYNLDNYQNIETPHYIQIIIMTLPYKKPINKKGNRHKTRGNNSVKAQIQNTINVIQYTPYNFTEALRHIKSQTSKVKLLINLQQC